jgi:hypothetical protein
VQVGERGRELVRLLRPISREAQVGESGWELVEGSVKIVT